jgi:hypothetical protein
MELLIRVKPKKGATLSHFSVGDVIVACPDGWAWSQEELTNPEWAIVRTSVLPIEANALMARYKEESLEKVEEPRRKYKMDLAILGINPDSRIPIITVAQKEARKSSVLR